ncbi:MAG TPA: carbonic anhydrase [Chryseosolibacter sp.]|nr:carbonic anhydrase [Chryseosolibacter sp.]
MTTKEKILLENKAWVQEKLSLDKLYFERLGSTHTPGILWIQSSDFLLPVQEIINTEPGGVLVYGNVANQIREDDLSLMAVLEDAIERLNVRDIIVCGFSHCEGITDVLLGVDDRPIVKKWLSPLRELYESHKEELLALDFIARERRLSELNIDLQLHRLADLEIVKSAWERNSFPALHGWYFDLDTGFLKEVFSMEPKAHIRKVASLI